MVVKSFVMKVMPKVLRQQAQPLIGLPKRQTGPLSRSTTLPCKKDDDTALPQCQDYTCCNGVRVMQVHPNLEAIPSRSWSLARPAELGSYIAHQP